MASNARAGCPVSRNSETRSHASRGERRTSGRPARRVNSSTARRPSAGWPADRVSAMSRDVVASVGWDCQCAA